LRKKNCRDHHFIRKIKHLFRMNSSNSNRQRRWRFYKFCRCYLVDWSSCSHSRLLKHFFLMSTTSQNFLIVMRICVKITILRRERKFVVCFVTAISSMNNTYARWLMRTSSNEKNFAKLFVKIIKTKILINNCIF
jgi:hypothetical protein